MIPTNHNPQQGFALLLTLLMIGVVLSVTLSMVELSMKQLALSVNSRDSEAAFQAANAGLECAERISRSAAATFDAGTPLTFDCFETTKTVSNNTTGISGASPSNGKVTRYQAKIEWGTGNAIRCSKVDMITMVANTNNITISGLLALIPSYPSNAKTCAGPGRCTIASVTGYSSTCANTDRADTLRREILLEF